MNTRQPLISFVTPTFNSVATVGDTIASVEREAAAFDYEHIVIDGGSCDGTVAAVRKLAGDRVLITSEPDRGVYDAMNKGIRRARGEWVAILNSDDFYLPGAVAAMVEAARADPSANVLHGDMVVRFEDGREALVKPGSGWRGRIGIEFPISHPTMWVRRSVYDRYGLYDTRYRYASDQDIFFRFLDRHERMIYISRPITVMRAGGLSGRYFDDGTLELLEIHSSRRGIFGLAAHLRFYREPRLRNHPMTPADRWSYWRWAIGDCFRRRSFSRNALYR